jgi:GNAT superfamily N-acetyltransferase
MASRLERMEIIRLQQSDASDVADVLSEAFFDYPVMRYVLGTSDNYEARLPELVSVFVAARALLNDPMLGVRDGARLVAAMTMSNPANSPAPEFAALKTELWQRLGGAAEHRYEQCVSTWESLAVHEPQLHVNMIGVRRTHQGRGLARLLLAEAYTLCAHSPPATGVSLTTEEPRNVDFYRHLGYDVVGSAAIADEVSTWSFFRRCTPNQ